MAPSARMLRIAVTSTLLVTGLGAGGGCLLVHPHPARHHGSRSAAVDCPPGHRWSDGRCHDKGKGHDPGKSRGKDKKH